LLLIAFVAC